MPLTQGKLINKTDAATSEYGSLRIVKIGDAKISDMYGAPVRQINAADQVEQRTFSNAALTDYHGNLPGNQGDAHILKNNPFCFAVTV